MDLVLRVKTVSDHHDTPARQGQQRKEYVPAPQCCQRDSPDVHREPPSFTTGFTALVSDILGTAAFTHRALLRNRHRTSPITSPNCGLGPILTVWLDLACCSPALRSTTGIAVSRHWDAQSRTP